MDIKLMIRFRTFNEVKINLQKIHSSWQSKDYNSGRKKVNLLLFCLIFIFVFQKCQNSFSICPPFGRFWSTKYLDFGG